MTEKEFRYWLIGFKRGCGVEKLEELDKTELLIVLEQASNIIPEYKGPNWWTNYPTITYTIKGLGDITSTISGSTSGVMDRLQELLNTK